jgi:hypothetical protein
MDSYVRRLISVFLKTDGALQGAALDVLINVFWHKTAIISPLLRVSDQDSGMLSIVIVLTRCSY